jgi:hypothetical protein
MTQLASDLGIQRTRDMWNIIFAYVIAFGDLITVMVTQVRLASRLDITRLETPVPHSFAKTSAANFPHRSCRAYLSVAVCACATVAHTAAAPIKTRREAEFGCGILQVTTVHQQALSAVHALLPKLRVDETAQEF